MTTPDIAAQCEGLRAITTTDHERLCQGREYVCSCGWDAENEAKATKAADTIERQAAEIERLRGALIRQTDNMAFVLNCFELYNWTEKFSRELAEDRAALTGEDRV